MRMTIMAICAASALTGCAVQGGFGGEQAFGPEQIDALRVQVARVDALELGRTRTGLALAAFGSANEGGWAQPALRRRGVGADGMIELEFAAIPPQDSSAGGATLRADAMFDAAELAGAKGFRVIARENSARITFGP